MLPVDLSMGYTIYALRHTQILKNGLSSRVSQMVFVYIGFRYIDAGEWTKNNDGECVVDLMLEILSVNCS